MAKLNQDPIISIHLKEEGKINYEKYYLLPRKVMFDVKSFYKFLNNILVNNFWLKNGK